MVIFDFDQTLVDTRPIARLRSARNSTAVMAQAYRLNAYNGINDLLSKRHKRGQTLAIVTNAPDMVPKVFIKRYKWPIEIVVGFHSATRCESDPEGLMLAMAIADADPEDTFHAFREKVGPFGTLLMTGLDWDGPTEGWERQSMQLLAHEVMSKFRQHILADAAG